MKAPLRHTLFILALLAWVSFQAAGKDPAPDFSKYSQTDSFKGYLALHTNAAWHFQQKHLLAISAFPSGDRYALNYYVTENGRENDHRDAYNLAIQDSQSKQLAETNLASLRLAISNLPTASTTPPIERLVIVSFRETTNWVTRSYDSSALPKSMRQIYDIIGERFESKKKK